MSENNIKFDLQTYAKAYELGLFKSIGFTDWEDVFNYISEHMSECLARTKVLQSDGKSRDVIDWCIIKCKEHYAISAYLDANGNILCDDNYLPMLERYPDEAVAELNAYAKSMAEFL